jgi:hypothetical protein
MEAVAAAASNAGILSLTPQGIQAINTLRSFYKHCTDEVGKAFLYELGVSARLLADTKYLCNKIDQTDSKFKSELRLASLRLQIEDCTADLELWLNVAKKIDHRTNRLHRNKFFKRVKSTEGALARQLVRLINAVYKISMIIVTSQFVAMCRNASNVIRRMSRLRSP